MSLKESMDSWMPSPEEMMLENLEREKTIRERSEKGREQAPPPGGGLTKARPVRAYLAIP